MEPWWSRNKRRKSEAGADQNIPGTGYVKEGAFSAGEGGSNPEGQGRPAEGKGGGHQRCPRTHSGMFTISVHPTMF